MVTHLTKSSCCQLAGGVVLAEAVSRGSPGGGVGGAEGRHGHGGLERRGVHVVYVSLTASCAQ